MQCNQIAGTRARMPPENLVQIFQYGTQRLGSTQPHLVVQVDRARRRPVARLAVAFEAGQKQMRAHQAHHRVPPLAVQQLIDELRLDHDRPFGLQRLPRDFDRFEMIPIEDVR